MTLHQSGRPREEGGKREEKKLYWALFESSEAEWLSQDNRWSRKAGGGRREEGADRRGGGRTDGGKDRSGKGGVRQDKARGRGEKDERERW